MIQISELQTIMDGFDFTYILSIVLGILPSLICITVHELSHGYAAYLLGDDTAKMYGRLSLNPVKHLDLLGLLMMLTFRFGWAKPVPVNMYKFRNPRRGMAVTALAGPLSNILLSILFLALFGFLYLPLSETPVGDYFLRMIELTAYMSIGLAVFNMLPVPPLDGSKIVFSVIGDGAYRKLMKYERYGGLVMLLLAATGLLGKPVSAAVSFLFDRLFVVAQRCFELGFKLFY